MKQVISSGAALLLACLVAPGQAAGVVTSLQTVAGDYGSLHFVQIEDPSPLNYRANQREVSVKGYVQGISMVALRDEMNRRLAPAGYAQILAQCPRIRALLTVSPQTLATEENNDGTDTLSFDDCETQPDMSLQADFLKAFEETANLLSSQYVAIHAAGVLFNWKGGVLSVCPAVPMRYIRSQPHLPSHRIVGDYIAAYSLNRPLLDNEVKLWTELGGYFRISQEVSRPRGYKPFRSEEGATDGEDEEAVVDASSPNDEATEYMNHLIRSEAKKGKWSFYYFPAGNEFSLDYSAQEEVSVKGYVEGISSKALHEKMLEHMPSATFDYIIARCRRIRALLQVSSEWIYRQPGDLRDGTDIIFFYDCNPRIETEDQALFLSAFEESVRELTATAPLVAVEANGVFYNWKKNRINVAPALPLRYIRSGPKGKAYPIVGSYITGVATEAVTYQSEACVVSQVNQPPEGFPQLGIQDVDEGVVEEEEEEEDDNELVADVPSQSSSVPSTDALDDSEDTPTLAETPVEEDVPSDNVLTDSEEVGSTMTEEEEEVLREEDTPTPGEEEEVEVEASEPSEASLQVETVELAENGSELEEEQEAFAMASIRSETVKGAEEAEQVTTQIPEPVESGSELEEEHEASSVVFSHSDYLQGVQEAEQVATQISEPVENGSEFEEEHEASSVVFSHSDILEGAEEAEEVTTEVAELVENGSELEEEQETTSVVFSHSDNLEGAEEAEEVTTEVAEPVVSGSELEEEQETTSVVPSHIESLEGAEEVTTEILEPLENRIELEEEQEASSSVVFSHSESLEGAEEGEEVATEDGDISSSTSEISESEDEDREGEVQLEISEGEDADLIIELSNVEDNFFVIPPTIEDLVATEEEEQEEEEALWDTSSNTEGPLTVEEEAEEEDNPLEIPSTSEVHLDADGEDRTEGAELDLLSEDVVAAEEVEVEGEQVVSELPTSSMAAGFEEKETEDEEVEAENTPFALDSPPTVAPGTFQAASGAAIPPQRQDIIDMVASSLPSRARAPSLTPTRAARTAPVPLFFASPALIAEPTRPVSFETVSTEPAPSKPNIRGTSAPGAIQVEQEPTKQNVRGTSAPGAIQVEQEPTKQNVRGTSAPGAIQVEQEPTTQGMKGTSVPEGIKEEQKATQEDDVASEKPTAKVELSDDASDAVATTVAAVEEVTENSKASTTAPPAAKDSASSASAGRLTSSIVAQIFVALLVITTGGSVLL